MSWLSGIRLSSVLIVVFVAGAVVSAIIGQGPWDTFILFALIVGFFRD